MMRVLYIILSFPAWVCFLVYQKRCPVILEDFNAWVERRKLQGLSTHSAFVKLMQTWPEYRSLYYYRLPFIVAHVLGIFLRRTNLKFSTLSCDVGGGMIIEHGWGSIILAERVGKNFTIHQNCTIGWNHGGKPIIGDNVKMYPGAVVAGPIKVGDNVTIGANCVVLNDIPDNSVCMGDPCKIKIKETI